MSEYSSFFNSNDGDRKYTAGEFTEYFASFIGNGVFWGGEYLKVNILRNMEIQVLPGKAWINGYYYSNRQAPKILTLEESHPTTARVDRVVIRLDLSQVERRISTIIKKGEPSATPTPPALQRDNAAWELGIGDIWVTPNTGELLQSNISDLRLSAELCGIVTGLVNQPDLTNIYNQYEAKYDEVCEHWDNWFQGSKDDWQDMKDIYESWFLQIQAELFATACTDFNDWSRRAGYSCVTEFRPNKDILETIKNRLNNSVLATRTTEFLTDGKIKETIMFTEPALVTVKTISFVGDTVVEDYV